MKKLRLIVIAIACCGFVHVGYSQAQIAIGIKGGPNFASLNEDAGVDANYENRTGFHAGGFALFKFGAFGIQPEVLFSQQGSNVQLASGQDIDTQISYINVPVIFKLYTPIGLNIQVGPQVGFLTTGEAENFANGATTTDDIKDELNDNDFALALGAGWDFPFGLTLDARYNLGLTDTDNPRTPQAKNQVWQFSAGFKLIKIGGRD